MQTSLPTEYRLVGIEEFPISYSGEDPDNPRFFGRRWIYEIFDRNLQKWIYSHKKEVMLESKRKI